MNKASATATKPTFGSPINTASQYYTSMTICIHFSSQSNRMPLLENLVVAGDTGTMVGNVISSNTDGGNIELMKSNTNYIKFTNTNSRFMFQGDMSIELDVLPSLKTDGGGNSDISRQGHPASCAGYAAVKGWNVQTPGYGFQIEVSMSTNGYVAYSDPPFNTTDNGPDGPFVRGLMVMKGSNSSTGAIKSIQWFINGAKSGPLWTGVNPMALDPAYDLIFGDYTGNGNPGAPNGNFYYNGKMSRFIMWNRALTDGEAITVSGSTNPYVYMDGVVASTGIRHEATTNTAEQTGTNVTFSHTVTNADFLTVCSSVRGVSVSSVTYGGVTMFLATQTHNAANDIWTDIRYATGPKTGANNVAVALSGAPTRWAASASGFIGVAQTNPIDVSTGNPLNLIGSTMTTTLNDDWLLDCNYNILESNPLAAFAGQTERLNLSGGDNYTASTKGPVSPGAGVSMNWSGGSGLVQSAVALKSSSSVTVPLAMNTNTHIFRGNAQFGGGAIFR